MSSEQYFGRNDTKVIKGIAALLMIIHHLWAFPDRIPLENGFASTITIFGDSLFLYLGLFSKFCVSMYMFLGGYGICKSWLSGKLDLVKKLKELYIAYWKIFLIFIPIGFIFFSEQTQYCAEAAICDRFSLFSFDYLLKDFFGLTSTYNREWWFLGSYVISILTFPMIVRLMDKKPVSVNIAGIIAWGILIDRVFPAIAHIETLGYLGRNPLFERVVTQTSPFITCFWMGVLMAKDDLLINLKVSLQQNKLLNPICDVLIGGVTTFLVNRFSAAYLDFLYVPIVIVVVLDLFSYVPFIYKAFEFVGRYSTNIWLCHSFFCYYYGSIAMWIVKSGNGYLSLLILVMVSLVASVAADYFWKILSTIKCSLVKLIKIKG